MAELLQSQLFDGMWKGEIEGIDVNDDTIEVIIVSEGKPLNDVRLSATDHKTVVLEFPIPQWALTDGVQTFILESDRGIELPLLTLVMGHAVTDDLRSEIGLLRAELDMLKKAFRQHVVKIMG